MDAADKRMLEREALRNMIQQWNANRLDLFALSEPNENLEFHGVMRFYFQDSGQKIATKCIRVASDATVSDVIEILIEKFRPDMRMLSLGSYSLWETHGPDDERKLEPHEKPLLVQLNWHADDREGRFLLKCLTNNEVPLSNDKGDQNFKRKLSKREKKELKKKEKLSRLKSDVNDENRPVAEKLYTELPETSFMRSISNPEAVMRRRRQQKLGRKLQQFKSKDGGPDTGGTLRIYGGILRPDVSYITLLLSVNDTAATVLRETLDKYGMSYQDPQQFCIVQEDKTDNSEYILEDDECPLAMMNMTRSSIMFHVRRRPADAQPRRRKKKVGTPSTGGRPGNEPMLVEVAPDTTTLENGRRVRITDVIEVGSGNGTALQLYGPSIQPRHCVVGPAADGNGYTVTPVHADAQVYLNGQRVQHTQRLQHGCLLKFGRVSTFRFIDPAQENLINRNLAQSQHFGSGSIYDRSPTSPGENSGAMSPTSLGSHQPDALDNNANNTAHDADYMRTMSPVSHDTFYREGNDTITPYNNNTLKLDNESLMMSQQLCDAKDDYAKDEHSVSTYNDRDQSANTNRTMSSQYKDNYETTFDLDGNVETKSICSAKSGGSGHDNRLAGSVGSAARPGQEAILPAVLEFPEAGQNQFLNAVITRLDPHAPAFKLAPVYTLYLCARYRASTHYRPELTPTERAHKLTAFLHHVATLIHATVQERCTDSAAQAFWMANASELLHFLKYDRHISSFSTQAQDLLPTTVQNAFSNLVTCFQEELSRALVTLTSVSGGMEATDATAPTLQALAAAMVLLRRCRVNAALTIQLFSHLFHYINAVCFNKLVRETGCISASWGAALSARLALLAAWAERQGLELAADCHLARTHQAARLIQGEYRTTEEVRAALGACFKLNSVQVRALLTPIASPEVVEAAVQHARALADELCRADGREVVLEESSWLGAGLLIPGDGFSAEVVRGVPPGLAEFVAPLQRGGLCRLAHQPHAIGLWTVYMCAQTQNRRAHDPRVHIIQLNKNSNGMGLSIVAAKGAGQSKLGIYIKSVVPGGAAAADGRLAAGDQLLSVDGQSLVGITQEKAAEYLVRTGPTVTLEVAKQGAMLHGLATLLHQPAYNQRQDEEVQYEDRLRRNSGTFTNPHPMLLKPASPLTELATAGNGGGTGAVRRASERDLPSRLLAEPVKPSKSTPALHHAANANAASPKPHHHTPNATLSPSTANGSPTWASKSRSSHNLSSAAPHDGFYQNLSTVHSQQAMHLQDRWSSLRSSTGSNRPQSAHFSASTQQEQPPDSPLHHQQSQPNIMSARAAKLAELSEEVTRRQQQQKQPLNLPHQHPPTHNHVMGQSPHLHQQQPQYQPQAGPQLANSHPHSTQHQQQIYHNQQVQQQRYEWHPPGPPSPQRSQPPIAPKPQSQNTRKPDPEFDERLHQQMQRQPQQQSQLQQQQAQLSQSQLQQHSQLNQQSQLQQQQMHLQQQQNQMQHQQQQMQLQQQSQFQAQSQLQQQQLHSPHQSQQHLQYQQQHTTSTVQPEDERYVASAFEPPAVSVYPAGGSGGAGAGAKGAPPYNPWQREERERQAEVRRAIARARRDAAISQLVALGANRTPVQNQQLRALQLERDFELRATQHDQEEGGVLEVGDEEDRSSPEGSLEGEPRGPPQPQPQPHPPKSILKSNTRTDVIEQYVHRQEEVVQEESSVLTEISSGMSALGVGIGAPPPPQRGSSFAVMASRARALSPPNPPAPHPALHPQHNANVNANANANTGAPAHPTPAVEHTPAPQSPVAGGRDKRVSFEERAPPAPPASSPPPLHDAPPREDPDRFIEEAENMLLGPGSPTTPTSALGPITHTPGVIGAQEVYRDPRARRLAEQQARAPSAPVPEQLSFKEKMKMFALESGEASTPKDKVKISRAQRDIDAVH